MVDAGSSGTRFVIYQWDNTDQMPNVIAVPGSGSSPYRIDIKLASAASDPKIISQIFHELIDASSRRFPSSEHGNARIFVYATAGMRDLPKNKQTEVMKKVYDYLAEYSPYRVKPKYCRVITGYEEGIFGWISANVLLNKFNESNRVGVSDMGGASLQLTFEAENNTKSANEMYLVRIGSQLYTLYAHSWLGLGQDKALEALTNVVVTEYHGAHPCMTIGYNSSDPSFHGTGNWTQCRDLINNVLLGKSFRDIPIAPMTDMQKLYGIASFAYYVTFAESGTKYKKKIESLTDMKNFSMEFARLNYSEIREGWPDVNERYLRLYFFIGLWCYSVLVDGFNMTDESFDFAFVDSVKNRSLSWDLGAVINYVHDIFVEDEGRLSLGVIVGVSMGIFGVFLIVFIIYLVFPRKNEGSEWLLSM
jgi:Golgi nucleoside diphosphatase